MNGVRKERDTEVARRRGKTLEREKPRIERCSAKEGSTRNAFTKTAEGQRQVHQKEAGDKPDLHLRNDFLQLALGGKVLLLRLLVPARSERVSPRLVGN